MGSRMLNDNYRDYTYFKDKGWFESEYYGEALWLHDRSAAGRRP